MKKVPKKDKRTGSRSLVFFYGFAAFGYEACALSQTLCGTSDALIQYNIIGKPRKSKTDGRFSLYVRIQGAGAFARITEGKFH